MSIATLVADLPVPGPELTKDKTDRRVVGLFRPYRGRVGLIAGTIVLASALGVVVPFLTQAIFDRALFPGDGDPRLGLLGLLVGISIAITLLSALIGVGQT